MLKRLRHGGATTRAMLLVLLACATLLRVAVPQGWMPVFDVAGVRLTVCTGMGPLDGMPAMAMPGPHRSHPVGDGHSTSDHPCAFAGLAAAVDEPPLPALPLPSGVRSWFDQLPRAAVGVGRGLAAPPPPATGPPLLA